MKFALNKSSCWWSAISIGFISLTGLGSSAFAQAVDPATIITAIPGFLEGPTKRRQGVGGNDISGFRTLQINGVTAIVGRGGNNGVYTVPEISSPTTDGLGWADITGAKLPGRTQRGFLGGTCLCETVVLEDTNPAGVPDWNHVMVAMTLEPAENVLVGRITASNCTNQACDTDGSGSVGLQVNGAPLDMVTDPRLTTPAPSNRGFELDMMASQNLPNWIGTPASAEGYYGKAINEFAVSHLHLYMLDIEGGVLLNSGTTEVSADRIQGRQRDGECEYRIQGFTHDPQAGLVNVARADNGAPVLTANAVADADDLSSTFGIWDGRNDVAGDCAEELNVSFQGVAITVPVDIRID